jgi:hypothetical protein
MRVVGDDERSDGSPSPGCSTCRNLGAFKRPYERTRAEEIALTAHKRVHQQDP